MSDTTLKPRLVTTQTACQLLSITSAETLHVYRRAGILRGHKTGTAAAAPWRWSMDDIDRLVTDPPADLPRLLDKARKG